MIIGTIKTIFELDINYLIENNVKALICDLDQTLASAFSLKPDDNVYKIKKELNDSGIQMYVISNNFDKRVRPYCQSLNVDYLSFSLKFTSIKVKRWLKKKNLKIEDIVFVGDQLRTDGRLTDKLKARLILTSPLVEKDNLVTKVFRKKDQKKILKLKEQNKLGVELPKK